MAMIRRAWLVTEGRRFHVFPGQRTDTKYGYRIQSREFLVFWLPPTQRGFLKISRAYFAHTRRRIDCVCCLAVSSGHHTVTTSLVGCFLARMILYADVITHFGLSPKVGLGSWCWCHPSGQSSSRGRIAAVKTPPVVATLCDPSNESFPIRLPLRALCC